MANARTHTVAATAGAAAPAGSRARTHTVLAATGTASAAGGRARTHTILAAAGEPHVQTVWFPRNGQWVQAFDVRRPRNGQWVST